MEKIKKYINKIRQWISSNPLLFLVIFVVENGFQYMLSSVFPRDFYVATYTYLFHIPFNLLIFIISILFIVLKIGDKKTLWIMLIIMSSIIIFHLIAIIGIINMYFDVWKDNNYY